MPNTTRLKHLIICSSVCAAHVSTWCLYLCSEQLAGQVNYHFQLQKARMFLKGDCWLESENQGTWCWCLRRALESNPLISCLLIESPVQNIPYMPSVVGVGVVCDIQPREELLSNCVLPSGCLQLPVMFCFDDGNSSVLCSQGSLCVSRWGVRCVHRFFYWACLILPA